MKFFQQLHSLKTGKSLVEGGSQRSRFRLLKRVAAKQFNDAALIIERKSFVKAGFELFFVPSEEHMNAFRRGGNLCLIAGPSSTLPGSVGFVEVWKSKLSLTKKHSPQKFFVIKTIQSSFRVSRNEGNTHEVVKPKPSQSVSNSLAKRYSDWRIHLLRQVFFRASKSGIGVVLEKQLYTRPSQISDFIGTAESQGYKIKRFREYILAVTLPKLASK